MPHGKFLVRAWKVMRNMSEKGRFTCDNRDKHKDLANFAISVQMFCTASTKALYCQYKSFVLMIQKMCTDDTEDVYDNKTTALNRRMSNYSSD